MSSPRVASGAASLDPKASEASSEPASSSVVSDLVENDEACTLIEPSKKQHKRSGSNVNNPPHLFAENTLILKHKRRYCKIEGCNSIVKSQGLCQRHGAKPKTCKVEGCTKQAQGNFDKMCKAHFKAMKRMTTPIPKVQNKDVPPPAQGFSVYDSILPDSLNFETDEHNNDTRKMPLIVHLKEGFDTLKPPAWHRNEERRARGMFPIDNPAAQLEGWERELVWMEILVLTGVPGASFRHLARAWGRDKGFHMVLAQFICERHGDVERKKRHGENKGDAKKKRRKIASPKKALSNSDAKDEIDSGGAYSNNEDVGADVWDPSLYGDVDTNEALAAEIFDFTEKEFERVVSKYRQGQPSGDSISTSTAGDRNISISSTTTDIVTQAAMTAILGQQQQQQPMHHRSDSLHSNAPNNNHEEILPTPVHVEVSTGVATNPVLDHAPSATSLAPTMPSNTTLAPGYHNQVPPRDYSAPQQQPHQIQELMPQQQQVFQPTQVPAPPPPPMQVPGHIYPPQQHIQVQAAPHQIIQQQQQLPAYSMHPASINQTQPAQQGEPQPVAQQTPTSIQTPMQQVHQPEAHAQSYPQQQTYTLPSGQPQQPLAPVAAPATQFSHPQPPIIQPQHAQPQQGHQQQQYEVNVPSYPQHKQEPFNPPAPQHHEDVSYEQKLLNSYETAIPANPPAQQSHSMAQQPLVPIAAPHPHQQQPPQQQHHLPLQYAQPTTVPGPTPVDLAPSQEPHAQHPFPPGDQQQQQIQSQIERHPAGAVSSLPQASGQQIVHAAYPHPPPQEHVQPQEHTNQMMGHPDHEAQAQDPLDVHHAMNAAREDQT